MKELSRKIAFRAAALAAACVSASVLAADGPVTKPAYMGPQTDGDFVKVILDADDVADGKVVDAVKDPMELAVAPDGRVFYIERAGVLKVWKPSTQKVTVAGQLEVFTDGGMDAAGKPRNLEEGLLGITLDPNFAKNNWVYLFYSPASAVENRVSRFTLEGDALALSSEKILLRIATQRDQCCHSGGSLTFDSYGNLYASTGDNTNPFESDGFAPIDERPGRSPWDAQKSSGNANDLRGKILRIHPEADGSYTVPQGNLFSAGTEGARPEIYIMGNRNPFRIAVDPRSRFLYWGDVGPDAQTMNPKRGPAGFDEINQARTAGNYGWPFFLADNRAYVRYNFESKESGEAFDPAKPVNLSPNNTGIKELPPAQPATLFYPYGPSARNPVVGSGGRSANAGPVYYFDPQLKSETKLPAEFDSTLFIYDWARNWILAVKLDTDGKFTKVEPFVKNMIFKRPMDMELGPDGCLYMIEFGSNFRGVNGDSQVFRIEHRKKG